MKQLPAILFIAAAVLFGSVFVPAQAAPILDFAVRVGCDFQQPEKGLMDLHVLQGSTPLILAMPKSGNTSLTPDTDTSVRMIIGPSETGSIYAARTNYAIAGGGYSIDWPTIGTNSSGQAWFYTLLFDREGKTYWSGTGALYIDESAYTGPDGFDWIEYTIPNVGWENVVGDASNNASLVSYVATSAMAGYLPLTGYEGMVVLGTTIRGHDATTNIGTYGFAVGFDTAAGEGGFAAGISASAGYCGFAAGDSISAGYCGFAAGERTSVGNYGFAAGRRANGADGSFVFADNRTDLFDRTGYQDSFSIRAQGGVYAEVGTNILSATTNGGLTWNGVELGTVECGTCTGDLAATNTPTEGQMLYASDATKTNLYFADAPSGTVGTGWTNLAFLGTGNAITGATAAADTLTLQRGEIEGGTGGTGSTGAESDALKYTWATNITLVAGTNCVAQYIDAISGTTTITPPTIADTNNSATFVVTIPATGTNTVTILTNSPAVLGYVPTISTNAESDLLWRWTPRALGWRVGRLR